MLRTGYILNRRDDLIWFIGLPVAAIALALASQQWLPVIALASVNLWITISQPGCAPAPTPLVESDRVQLRETELVEQFPVQVVTEWLGNCPSVALRHYLMTTDEHWSKAVSSSAAQNAAQHLHELGRTEPQASDAAHEKTPELPGSATECDSLQLCPVEAGGIEPPSCEP